MISCATGVARAASRFHTVTAEVFAMTEARICRARRGRMHGCNAVPGDLRPRPSTRCSTNQAPKADYAWRLDAPARALAAACASVGLGVLLGLSEPLEDILRLFRHAAWLRRRFWAGGVAISFPRIRPQSGDYAADFPVSERLLAQIVFAFRIAMPDVTLVSPRAKARASATESPASASRR